jgi:3-hydroxyisobutyrate dehydrogenase-like beta-hydroxyacid dehydrogenase
MAASLIRAGHQIIVVDRNPAAVAKLEQLGARAAKSAREIAETPGRHLGVVNAVVTAANDHLHV